MSTPRISTVLSERLTYGLLVLSDRFGHFQVVRDDGLKQWAYKGKPVYAFVKDAKPGQKGEPVKPKFLLAAALEEPDFSAEFKDGILKVHLPKDETAKPKGIEVKID